MSYKFYVLVRNEGGILKMRSSASAITYFVSFECSCLNIHDL